MFGSTIATLSSWRGPSSVSPTPAPVGDSGTSPAGEVATARQRLRRVGDLAVAMAASTS